MFKSRDNFWDLAWKMRHGPHSYNICEEEDSCEIQTAVVTCCGNFYPSSLLRQTRGSRSLAALVCFPPTKLLSHFVCLWSCSPTSVFFLSNVHSWKAFCRLCPPQAAARQQPFCRPGLTDSNSPPPCSDYEKWTRSTWLRVKLFRNWWTKWMRIRPPEQILDLILCTRYCKTEGQLWLSPGGQTWTLLSVSDWVDSSR